MHLYYYVWLVSRNVKLMSHTSDDYLTLTLTATVTLMLTLTSDSDSDNDSKSLTL